MLKKLLLLTLVISSIFNTAHATHIPGANITYTCSPGNPLTYNFTLTLFRVCPGTHPATQAASYFTLTNTCGLVNPVIPTFTQSGVAVDVNQLCATATSDCSGGTSPGLWKYTYEATITFPADCDSWTIGFDLCCRDQSSNLTGGTSNNMATSTTMNTLTSPCNNSPVVTSVPMPYACANTPFNYCLTVADPDGDSTYFTMVAPSGAAQTPITFGAGYSVNAPLTNFVLNPLTGCFTFTEPTIGNYVVAIQIESYNSNGDLICTVIHDFQVIVMSCTNSPPQNPAGGLLNFSGTGTLLGPNTIGACFGDNVCFDVVFSDPLDPTDVITIQQDGTSLLPGATFVQTGTNPATGTFCWIAQPGYTGSIITFVAADDGCPVMGTSGFAVDFNIATGVYAGPDPIICGTQSAALTANGASSYVWSPAAGLSCTNCPNPIATPGSTTIYTVTGNLVGTCPNVDQVTVNVVADFPLTMNPLSATICANEVVQLNASGPGAMGPYIYDWTPVSTLNNGTISNPLANPLTSTIYTATLTAANGCTKTATANIIVSGVGPTVTIVPSTIDICAGESVPFTTSAAVYPVTCGISAGCTGTSSNAFVGTETNATTSYTPFYGSTLTTTNYTNKSQFIYTAAELNALGYYGGTINAIALNVTSSYTYLYDNVEIWIACTSQDEFTSTAFTPISGMTQVYSASNVDLTNGAWHSFDITDWDWDGSSNLIIQMCAEENNTLDVGSESVRYSSTSPAYRCIYNHSTIALSPSCDALLGSRTTIRPNMRFNICVGNTVSPTYVWTPAAGLNNAGIANPTATPSTTTSYVLNVTSAGCTGSAIAQVNVSPNYTLNAAASPISLCYGASTSLSPNPSVAGAYSYLWSPGGAFTNPTISNPTVTPTGSTTYYVSTSNGYCNKTDSIIVNVSGLPASALASDDTVCMGTNINLDMIAASATCGANYSDCAGSLTTGTSAVGASATSVYGPFYGSTILYTNKVQYIFTAAELTAMGFTPGMITELALNVSTSTGRSYNDMTIWMGCTAQDQYLTTSFIPSASLTQVYYNTYYTAALGWNTFDITGYDWDGVSNIVIQFCSQNNDLTGSENIYYTTTTPAYRCMYYQSSSVSACANATGSRVVNRPNMRFKMCTTSFGAGVTYTWSPAAGLSNSTIQNPVATVNATTTYTLTVVDPLNPACPSTANVTVAIDPSNALAASPDTLVCPGDPAQLNSVFSGTINPITVPCGIAGSCTGPSSQYIAGPMTGQNTTTSWPAPYGNFYRNAKHQFLYTAAELNALGISGGKITEVAWQVLTINGTTTYNSFQISMGCTTTPSLTAWETGLTLVKNPSTVNIVVGANSHPLDNAYNWDGYSNLVIEICYNNLAVAYTSNSSSPWTTTTFNSSLYYYSDGIVACTNPTGTPSLNRPVMRFTVCDPPPLATLVYSWSPAGTLSDPNIANPIATPPGPETYIVTVTGGLCTVYDTVVVGTCLILPIELSTFAGQNIGEMNELNWTTESESDNDYFTVQRSIDGVNFITIGTVDGAGNSNTILNYRMLDMDPMKGINYYRLRQTDFDGATSYSAVIAINTQGLSGIQIYPNPSSHDLFLDINETVDEGMYTIVITDLVGKIMQEQVDFSKNQTTYKIENFRTLTSGVYLIQVIDDRNEIVKFEKVIKQ